jgi:hypothetical protein
LEGPVRPPDYGGMEWLTEGWSRDPSGSLLPILDLGWETTPAFLTMPVILVNVDLRSREEGRDKASGAGQQGRVQQCAEPMNVEAVLSAGDPVVELFPQGHVLVLLGNVQRGSRPTSSWRIPKRTTHPWRGMNLSTEDWPNVVR